MFELLPGAQNLISAATGLAMGLLGAFGAVKCGNRAAQASDYATMVKRLTEVENRADAMGATIYKKDRQLIAAAEEAADAKLAAQRAEERTAEVEERYRRLEHAFDELLKRTRMPAIERERLRLLYRGGHPDKLVEVHREMP